jgi:TPR repeat protein
MPTTLRTVGVAIALLLACSVGVRAGDAGGPSITVDAVYELRTAAAGGDPAAMLRMAKLYEQGVRGMDGTLLVPRNYGEAFKLYTAAATGDIIPEALFAVGVCYEMGLGVTPDPAKAAEHYQKAVKLLYPPAMIKVAELLLDGRIFPKAVDRGLEFLETAFKVGNADAAYQLALVHLQGRFEQPVDQARGVQWLSEAVKMGQLDALRAMAELRNVGVAGVLEKDTGEGMKWYLILAKTGNLPQEAAQKAQALRNSMTQAEVQAADDNAVKWMRELDAAQTRSRDSAARATEQRLSAFRAASR